MATEHSDLVLPTGLSEDARAIMMVEAQGFSHRTATWWFWLRTMKDRAEDDIPDADELREVPLG